MSIRWLAAPLPDTSGIVANTADNAAALTTAFGPPTPIDYWWYWRGAPVEQWPAIVAANEDAADSYIQAGYQLQGGDGIVSPERMPPVMRVRDTVPFCPSGKMWDGKDCVDRTPLCVHGQTWDGSKCVTTLSVVVVTPGSSSGSGSDAGVILIALAAIGLFVATLNIKPGELSPTRANPARRRPPRVTVKPIVCDICDKVYVDPATTPWGEAISDLCLDCEREFTRICLTEQQLRRD